MILTSRLAIFVAGIVGGCLGEFLTLYDESRSDPTTRVKRRRDRFVLEHERCHGTNWRFSGDRLWFQRGACLRSNQHRCLSTRPHKKCFQFLVRRRSRTSIEGGAECELEGFPEIANY